MGGQVSQDDRHAVNVKADFEGIILVALIMTYFVNLSSLPLEADPVCANVSLCKKSCPFSVYSVKKLL